MTLKRCELLSILLQLPAISGHICGSPYCITKAGLISLTKHIGSEYGQYNIRSYSIALGDIYTDTVSRSLSTNLLVRAKNENIMKRLGQWEEVEKSIASLAVENFSLLEILLLLTG